MSKFYDRFSEIDKIAASHQGHKILVMHQGISEINQFAGELASTDLPKTFTYYAMGHLHDKFLKQFSHLGGPIAYPGSIEMTTSEGIKETQKGLYEVDLSSSEAKPSWIKLDTRPQLSDKVEFENLKESITKIIAKISSYAKKPIIEIKIHGSDIDSDVIQSQITRGGFATAERQVIFDVNDFDEVSLAPWDWDIKRLAASFVIAGRSNGFASADCREAAWLAAQAYRQRMAEYSEMPVLEVWNDVLYFGEIIEKMQDKDMRRFYTKKLTSATQQSAHEKEFAKLTFSGGDTPRIIDQPPLVFHFGDQRDKEFFQVAVTTLKEYRKNISLGVSLLLDRFAVVDVAYKVGGVGGNRSGRTNAHFGVDVQCSGYGQSDDRRAICI